MKNKNFNYFFYFCYITNVRVSTRFECIIIESLSRNKVKCLILNQLFKSTFKSKIKSLKFGECLSPNTKIYFSKCVQNVEIQQNIKFHTRQSARSRTLLKKYDITNSLPFRCLVYWILLRDSSLKREREKENMVVLDCLLVLLIGQKIGEKLVSQTLFYEYNFSSNIFSVRERYKRGETRLQQEVRVKRR